MKERSSLKRNWVGVRSDVLLWTVWNCTLKVQNGRGGMFVFKLVKAPRIHANLPYYSSDIDMSKVNQMSDFGTFKKAPVKTRTLLPAWHLHHLFHHSNLSLTQNNIRFWSHRHFDWLGSLWRALLGNSFLDRKGKGLWERGDWVWEPQGIPSDLFAWRPCLTGLGFCGTLAPPSGRVLKCTTLHQRLQIRRPQKENQMHSFVVSRAGQWPPLLLLCKDRQQGQNCPWSQLNSVRVEVDLCLLLWDQGESQGKNWIFSPFPTSPDYSWVR